MSKLLEVIITSGGTISKIDDVRHIGNFSSGTTGTLIAEEFLRRGHYVHYIHAKNAKRPFRHRLIFDSDAAFGEEAARLRHVQRKILAYRDHLQEHAFETFEEYFSLVQELVTKKTANAIILAAAISDYGIKPVAGKISSDLESMTLELQRNPKVISHIKKWDPTIFQVGFKLLTNTPIEQLIDTGTLQFCTEHTFKSRRLQQPLGLRLLCQTFGHVHF